MPLRRLRSVVPRKSTYVISRSYSCGYCQQKIKYPRLPFKLIYEWFPTSLSFYLLLSPFQLLMDLRLDSFSQRSADMFSDYQFSLCVWLSLIDFFKNSIDRWISNHYVVPLKLIKCYVNYTSIKKKEISLKPLSNQQPSFLNIPLHLQWSEMPLQL